MYVKYALSYDASQLEMSESLDIKAIRELIYSHRFPLPCI